MRKIVLLSFIAGLFFACDSKNSNDQGAENGIGDKQVDWLAKGSEIAAASQKALGAQLKNQMQKGGPIAALEFCSVKAIPITDSLSEVHNARITRISDKNRNPNNTANHAQLDYMEMVQHQLKYGKDYKPMLEPTSKKPKAYVPIVTNAMCLQCHGTPGKEISDETYAKIQELYPDDKAIGYQENQVRGLWVIEMNR